MTAAGQLACRSTSSTAAGCLAITASKTRVGASGCDLPCSQLRKVAGGKPNLVANFDWLSPIFRRTLRTSGQSGDSYPIPKTGIGSSPRFAAPFCGDAHSRGYFRESGPGHFRSMTAFEVFHKQNGIAALVVDQLVNHVAGHQDAEAAGAFAFFRAHFHVMDGGIFGIRNGGVRERVE